MTDIADALDELVAQHRRIGSVVPEYLRPGLPADEVIRHVLATVGLDPPGAAVDLFVWHDGIDNEAWERDAAATGFARLFADAHYAPLADAVRHYHERIDTDEVTARYSMTGDAPGIWKASWFPVFCGGWDTYAIECDPTSPDWGAIYDPAWEPPVDVGPGPRFRDLPHLVESVIRRFQAGGYSWDPAIGFLDEQQQVLEPLYRREIAEARG